MKKSIKDLGDIKGKRALVRVDINVPLDENKNVTDDTRIQAILPTVKYLTERGAKVILMAHLGRPKGEWNEEIIGWQRRTIISHIATTYLLAAVMVTFIINIFRGLKKGVIFSRCNTVVIYAGAVIYALNSFYAYTAMNAASGRHVNSIDTDMCIYPLLIIILGLLHKLAVEASEENNLTI